MFDYQPSQYKHDSRRDSFQMFGYWFVRNKLTGIYEATAEERRDESRDVQINWPEKHRVKTDRDWPIILIPALLTAASLILLWRTVVYTHRQWHEAQQTALDSDKSADAAQVSATTAANALKFSQEQFKTEQRPIVWLISDLPKGKFVQLPTNKVGQITWDIVVKSYGTSPAVNVAIRLYVKMADEDWKSAFGQPKRI